MNFASCYRDRIGIISDILEVAKGGTAKTRIMYNANLSHDQLKEYLTVLTENNLLNYDAYTQTFKTTQKGLRFLNTYNWIGEAMKILPSIRL